MNIYKVFEKYVDDVVFEVYGKILYFREFGVKMGVFMVGVLEI